MAMLKGTFEFGRHICLVFDILGKSLAQFLSENAYRPFPRHQVQDIARQLLAGVACKFNTKSHNALLTSV